MAASVGTGEAVLTLGLSALAAPSLRLLLTHPGLLPHRQELVLIEGGPYWQQVAARWNCGASAATTSSEGALPLATGGDMTAAEQLATFAMRTPWPDPVASESKTGRGR